MRKKSHISLAKHIVSVTDLHNISKHRKAFYIGSILPDCKPSFLTKRHEINQTFDVVTKEIEDLTHGYENMEDLSTMYFTRLGEVIHYVADYFTFPHNNEYRGGFKQHCIYEGRLKHQLRVHIRNIRETNLIEWKENLGMDEIQKFRSVSDICTFIRDEHHKYIIRDSHSVEEDCKYIVIICSKIALAILHVCTLAMEAGNRLAVQ